MPSDLDRGTAAHRRPGAASDAPPPPPPPPPPPLLTISGALVSYLHTALGYLAFFGALALALSLHYTKVVRNGVAGWPHEWWPSVSATIGDWYPERNFFQVGIALMSGPRIALVLLSALLVSLSSPASPSPSNASPHHEGGRRGSGSGSGRAKLLAITGVLRTLACGGWVYVTSTDDHGFHDIAMILYLLLTPTWMYICGTSLSRTAPTLPSSSASASASASTSSTTEGATAAAQAALLARGNRYRKWASASFFSMIPFMLLFFYRHKVLELPGAYTHYAFFEWGLILFDLGFDAASIYDLARLEIHIVQAPLLQHHAHTHAPNGGSSAPAPPLLGGTWLEGGTEAAIRSGAWIGTSSRADGSSTSDLPPMASRDRDDNKRYASLLPTSHRSIQMTRRTR